MQITVAWQQDAKSRAHNLHSQHKNHGHHYSRSVQLQTAEVAVSRFEGPSDQARDQATGGTATTARYPVVHKHKL